MANQRQVARINLLRVTDSPPVARIAPPQPSLCDATRAAVRTLQSMRRPESSEVRFAGRYSAGLTIDDALDIVRTRLDGVVMEKSGGTYRVVLMAKDCGVTDEQYEAAGLMVLSLFPQVLVRVQRGALVPTPLQLAEARVLVTAIAPGATIEEGASGVLNVDLGRRTKPSARIAMIERIERVLREEGLPVRVNAYDIGSRASA